MPTLIVPAEEFLQTFIDSVTKLMAEIELKKIEKMDLGKTDRALSHDIQVMVRKWFYSNGGL